jgi:DNA polymerase-3 subunit beta
VLPKDSDKAVWSARDTLKGALSRALILTNEKFKGVRLNLESGSLKVTANNPEQEEAEEVLDVDYQGDELEIGFNVAYLIDVFNVLQSDNVIINLSNANASALIHADGVESALYVVMPMRL